MEGEVRFGKPDGRWGYSIPLRSIGMFDLAKSSGVNLWAATTYRQNIEPQGLRPCEVIFYDTASALVIIRCLGFGRSDGDHLKRHGFPFAQKNYPTPDTNLKMGPPSASSHSWDGVGHGAVHYPSELS